MSGTSLLLAVLCRKKLRNSVQSPLKLSNLVLDVIQFCGLLLEEAFEFLELGLLRTKPERKMKNRKRQGLDVENCSKNLSRCVQKAHDLHCTVDPSKPTSLRFAAASNDPEPDSFATVPKPVLDGDTDLGRKPEG